MVNLILVSHGSMAEGLLDAMQLIIDQQEGLVAIGLGETDAIDNLGTRIGAAIEQIDTGDGVLVLVDLFGASPFNISAQLTQNYPNVNVVTGMNLPMLLEITIQRGGMNLEDLSQLACTMGREGIKNLSEIIS